MSKVNTGGDEFGMEPQHEGDMRALEEMEGDTRPEEAPSKASTTGVLGVPVIAWVGVAVFVVLMLVAIGTVISQKMKSNRSQANDTALAIQSAQEMTAQQSERLKRDEVEAKATAALDGVAKVNIRLDKVTAGQSTQGLEERIARTEQALKQAQENLAAMARKVADNKPLDADMYIREDVRLVSIGGGVARVADSLGTEIALHKGDMWNGLVVKSIRADRRQVTLSDGSVIL